MQQIIDQLVPGTGAQIPTVLAAIGLLALGWVVSLAIAGLVRNLMYRSTLDVKIAGFFSRGTPQNPERCNNGPATPSFTSSCCLPSWPFFKH